MIRFFQSTGFAVEMLFALIQSGISQKSPEIRYQRMMYYLCISAEHRRHRSAGSDIHLLLSLRM